MEDLNMTTPPPELVQWWGENGGWSWSEITTRAAQWGADQELEACCALMDDWGLDASDLRAARRPKPLSLKQQSLALIDLIQGNEKGWDIRDLDVVRRALEALPDDRT